MKSILEYNIRIKGVIELGDLVFECTFSRLKVCHEQTICRTFLGMGVLSSLSARRYLSLVCYWT